MTDLTPKQQTLEQIKAAHQILLLTHKQPDGDALGSLLALGRALEKLGKKVTIVVPDVIAQLYRFLPGIEGIVPDLTGGGEGLITIALADGGVKKLGYKEELENKRLLIMVTPEKGVIRPEDVTVETGSYAIELIIALDCNSLDRLGDFYNDHPPIFYETPLINIDHHPDNEQFGTVNWVDVTATSTAEIMVSLLEALGRDTSLFDPDVATNLLTGITTDTGSFQNTNTTPKSLTVAAQLVAMGARQQEIIHHLYKVKPISTLKLWGKALTTIRQRPDLRVLWATVTADDFREAGAEETETEGLIDELLKTAEGVALVFLLSEKRDKIHVGFRAVEKGIDVSEIAKLMGGGGHVAAAGAGVEDTLAIAEEKVLEALQTFWAKRKR